MGKWTLESLDSDIYCSLLLRSAGLSVSSLLLSSFFALVRRILRVRFHGLHYYKAHIETDV